VARVSAATAAEAGVADGDKVTVATDRGSVTVPAEIVPMADHVAWLPAAGLPGGSTIRAELGVGHGATVTLRRPQ
jgi:NADH-quinone oxidoreductase subunit G